MLEYNELEIRAASGLHEDCLAIIQRQVPNGSRTIDLAAGAGAFSARLVDAGYGVTANDIDDGQWKSKNIPKLTLDLDKSLVAALPAAGFDLVIAMEVIEHLQNPSKLLDDCRRLVTNDGLILLSTPNVLDLESRLIYLRSGFLFHISPQSYFATGHRTILPYWLLELLIAKAGLEIVEKHWGGQVPIPSNQSIWRKWAMKILRIAVKPFVKSSDARELDANYLIYLLRVKTDASAG